MKTKNIFLALFIAVYGLNAYADLYLIGNAAPNGWNNMAATELSFSDTAYVWTGYLNAGDFKFITTLGSWSPCYNATTADEIIVLGQAHNIVLKSDGTDDYKFTLATAGYYTINVNPTTLKMVITTTKNNLYLIGDATPNGWNNMAATELSFSDTAYVWTGYLNVGDFKFITTLGSWSPCYNATTADEIIVLGQAHNIVLKSDGTDDYKFTLATAGYYTININPTTLKMIVSEAYDNLYLIGGAVGGWANENRLLMPRKVVAEQVYEWSGFLSAGEMKIVVAAQDTWMPCFNASETNKVLTVNVSDTLLYNTGTGEDNKFSVLSGNYIVSVNLTTNKIALTELTTTLGEKAQIVPISVSVQNGFVHISAEGLSAAELLDLTGRTVATAYGNNSLQFAQQMSTNMYVLRAIVAGHTISRKITVR